VDTQRNIYMHVLLSVSCFQACCLMCWYCPMHMATVLL